jgi:probable phosphoglycerate mutase
MAPPRRRIYLLRHAEVRYVDASGRPVRPDSVSLTEQGRRQAEATARVLSAVALDRAISSGLPRTVETAGIVLEGRGLDVETREALQEIRPGRLDAIPPEAFESEFLGALRGPHGPEDRFLGGETWGALQGRVLPCVRALLAEPGWSHLLVVAHGGVNRVILLDALCGGLPGLGRLEQDPAAINILDVEADGALMVRLLNHTPYDETKADLRETTMERLYRDLHEAWRA